MSVSTAARPIYYTRVRGKNRVIELQRLRLEPLEFCRKWIALPESERGWKSRCNEVLADIAGVSLRSVERWGAKWESRPDWLPSMLAKQDLINEHADRLLDARYPPRTNSDR